MKKFFTTLALIISATLSLANFAHAGTDFSGHYKFEYEGATDEFVLKRIGNSDEYEASSRGNKFSSKIKIENNIPQFYLKNENGKFENFGKFVGQDYVDSEGKVYKKQP